MDTYILYFRHEGIYNNDVEQAVLTDAFLATMLTKGAKVSMCTVSEDKRFSNGSKHVSVSCEPCDIVLIGTIPYHLFIANLYHLEEKGFTVIVVPKFITTDVQDPSYPEDFIRYWDGVHYLKAEELNRG